MSDTALNEYSSARDYQLTRNDARRIRTRVEAAQQDPRAASLRWPFELIQNAHDAGPRDGAECVEVDFQIRDGNLVVSHTGKPFSAQELAALLSGGSSKEFDDTETTGRFGTGFLSTHVLSTRVDVEGIIETQEGFEEFTINLNRNGNEDLISENIAQANEAVREAGRIQGGVPGDKPTASFTYYNADSVVVEEGIERLKAVLPYLYGTCPRLGEVKIVSESVDTYFTREETTSNQRDDVRIALNEINVTDSGCSKQVTVVRVNREGSDSALLVALERDGAGSTMFKAPAQGFPRLFVQFPIAETSGLPLNVIIDGRFTPQQERDGITMNSADKNLIEAALSTLPTLIAYAVDAGWEKAHQIADIAAPESPLGGENATDETSWWEHRIRRVADAIARQPIVKTETGLLPAVSNSNGGNVSFLVPAISKNANLCVEYTSIHEVVSAITQLHTPTVDIAGDWAKIAKQWDDIGVSVERLGFNELTDWVKGRAQTVADVPVSIDPYQWLAQLFLLGADINDRNVEDAVDVLLPNQEGAFGITKKGRRLYEDVDVSDDMKIIADMVSIDLKSQLLHSCMTVALNAPGYESAKDLVQKLLVGEYTESKALEAVIEALGKDLENEHVFNGYSDFIPLQASARLVQHLSEAGEAGFEQHLRHCPLLTQEGKIAHLTGSQQILAPIAHWPVSAQPYADLYTETRILSGYYCDDSTVSCALKPLIDAGLVIEAPLHKAVRPRIDDMNLLNAMSEGALNVSEVTVRNEEFGQIAFLSTDLVNRCGQDQNGKLAKRLLDFVLTVAAKEDSSWRSTKEVTGHSSGERISLSLRGATWPFELKVRSWVPVQIPEEDRFQPTPANESNLRGILDNAWLQNNPVALELLSQVFGFRRITLTIDSLDPAIEDDVVKLLQNTEWLKSVVSNPEAVQFASELDSSEIPLDMIRTIVQDVQSDQDLIPLIEKRREEKRRVNENQNLGTLVEQLVAANLKEAGFSVRNTGIGSDFEIAAELGHAANLELTGEGQSWLVEVKATRDQRVRMTDTQARNAVKEGDRFLLCVVPIESWSSDLSIDYVQANMRFVTGMGKRVATLCNNLGKFEGMRDHIMESVSDGVQLEITSGSARVRVARLVWEQEGFLLGELASKLTQ